MRCSRSMLSLCLCCLVGTLHAQTFRVPDATTIRPIVGICTHERYSSKEVPVARDLGVSMVRFHYSWKEVEKTKDVYELPPTAWECMRRYKAAGISQLAILAYDNPLYNTQKDKPQFTQYKDEPQQWVEAFGRYCGWMAKTFGSRGTGQVMYWEVWNEQNHGEVEQYMALLREACQQIHANDPQARIIFGGVSRADIRFIGACLKAGAADLVDAIAFHPYRETTYPEATMRPTRYGFDDSITCYAEEFKAIRKLIDQYQPKDRQLEIWITETGWPTLDSQPTLDRKILVHQNIAAKYLLRTHIQNLALGATAIFWYRMTDTSFFGMTYGGDQFYKAPAYHALQNLLVDFPQYQNVKVLPWELQADPAVGDLHAYAFQTDPRSVLLYVWDAAGPTTPLIEPRLTQAKGYTLILPVKLNVSEVTVIDELTMSQQTCAVQHGNRLVDVRFSDSLVLIKVILPVAVE